MQRYHERMRCVLLVAFLGCGDNSGGPVPVVEAGCRDVPLTSVVEQFDSADDLGPVVGYTLDGFDPSGRWFFTDSYRGSTVLRRDENGRLTSSSLELSESSSQLFGTFLQQEVSDTGPIEGRYNFRFSERISNLREDGTMRYDSAYCETGEPTCRVCTAGMVRAERFDPQPSEKLALVGELASPRKFPRRTLDVTVLGTTAYVVDEDGLYAVDVADPAAPVLRGTYADTDTDTRSNDVVVFDATNGRRYAVIADSPVQIVDVTNPNDLQPAGQIPVEAHTLFLETRGNTTRIYFGSLDGTCPVWSFDDPAHPMRLGAFDAQASYVHDLYVEDGIGYLNAWEKGFFVVDFNDASAPVQLGHWPSPRKSSHSSWVTTIGGRRIAVHGDEAYGAHMTVLDVDPASPSFMRPLSEYETRDYVSIHNLTGAGTKTYFTHYQDGVRVVDLANPSQPKLVGYFNTWDPDDDAASTSFFAGAIGIDLDVARKLIFVADMERGLLILRDDT